MARLIDAGVLGMLVLALLIVVLLDRTLPTATSTTAPIPQGEAVKLMAQTPAKELRLAVTQGHRDKSGRVWDDMALMLRSLGAGYRFQEINSRELLNPQKLADIDVLFLTCAPGGASPESQVEKEFADNLRAFVSRGGTLYASDWRFDAVAAAFPEFVSRRTKGEGRDQELDADVLDPGLRDVVGAKLPLRFDLPRWKTAAFEGAKVKVLVEGKYERQQFGQARAPLLVKFQVDKGTVIFTSFHNEKQNSAIEQKLLKYLVFSAVTAKIENQVAGELIRGGFSPQKQNLLSASNDNPSVTHTYHSTKAGKIRFVLGFDNRGARLRLTVVSPSGAKKEHEDVSSFWIDEVSAGPGDWRYTVTALTVPFADFPFTVTVAESE